MTWRLSYISDALYAVLRFFKVYKILVTSYKSQVLSYKLQVTSYKLQVTSTWRLSYISDAFFAFYAFLRARHGHSQGSGAEGELFFNLKLQVTSFKLQVLSYTF